MQFCFRCAAVPDRIAACRRLAEVAGLGAAAFSPDGGALTVCSDRMQSAQEITIRLRELGWRRMI